jgi:hypothetical protein
MYLDLFEQDGEWLVELLVWCQWKQYAELCLNSAQSPP